MTLDGGLVTVHGIRLALAFVTPDLLRPGAGDALLARLGPYFPGLPIMLVARDGFAPQAYASFDTDALLAELDLAGMVEQRIELDLPPPHGQEPPF